jgi:hypothetical protein
VMPRSAARAAGLDSRPNTTRPGFRHTPLHTQSASRRMPCSAASCRRHPQHPR